MKMFSLLIRFLPGVVLLGFSFSYLFAEDLNQEMLKRIFVDRHLDKITSKGTLKYVFQGYDKNGRFFKDFLLTHITKIDPENLKTLKFDIFTGEQKRNFPELSYRHQNPVIIIFLQRDADIMSKIFSIQAQKVRSLVKKSFRAGMRTEKIQVIFNKQKLSCFRSILQPFLKEAPLVYKDFIRKTYQFTICPETPGKIYELKTDVKNDKGVSLFIERLRFVNFTKNK